MFEESIRGVAILLATMVVSLGCAAEAKDVRPAEPQSRAGAPGDRRMMGSTAGMQDMMSRCMQRCRETISTVDETMKVVDEAKRSGDPAAMSAALDRAGAALLGIKERTMKCMAMMKGQKQMMMERKRGGEQASDDV